MRLPYFCALYLAVVLPGFAQTAANAGPPLPTDPRAIFEAAAPFYDFTSPELKPWHLKATYQLYDEKGKFSEQGTYEYWWASPQVYRSTWTRPGATHTEWHMENGTHAYESTGEPINLFEYSLHTALLSPLPRHADLDPAKFRLEDEGVIANRSEGHCITIVPIMNQDEFTGHPANGPFPTYCFEPQRPVLQSVFSFEQVLTQYSDVVTTQSKYLARNVNISEGKHKLITARVDSIDQIEACDLTFTPPSSVTSTYVGKTGLISSNTIKINKEIMASLMIKKVQPIYPMEVKKAHVQGKVVVVATIGTDGKTYDLRVISAPSASLADSAFKAISQWEYKPYLLNGEPVPVETTVVVTYALGK
jgi:TonB family protein